MNKNIIETKPDTKLAGIKLKKLGAPLAGFALIFGFCVALYVAMPISAYAADEDSVVKFRKALMQEIGASLTSLSLLLKGGVSDDASFVLQAQILAHAAQRGEHAFIFKTRGVVEPTTAHARVWSKQEDFQKRMEVFARDAAAFSNLIETTIGVAEASSGASVDLKTALAAQAVPKAFGALAGQCKSCHKMYRTK